MPDGRDRLSVDVVERLADIGRDAWDACAGAANPFVGFDFLGCLEDTGCAGTEAGWAPRHMVARDGEGRVVGCAPAYLKGHSMGEYVFDWNWADAYERAGGRYYPKLVAAVPFTPATGPRLMARTDLDAAQGAEVRRALAGALAGLTERAGLSSAHVNFITDGDADALHEAGFLPRVGLQYHWKNNNYDSFDDFLGELSSRKRKALKKERKAVHDLCAGGELSLEHVGGADLRPEHWDAMHAFYLDTGQRKWGRPYLNREFFHLLGERMADRVLLILAKRDGAYVAGALNLIGADTLYGRYWGCREDIRYLHFELCYHQAIEAAIERGLHTVEAGAQGEHKIARGYLPVLTRSAHFIADPRLREAIGGFLDGETRAIEHERAVLLEESPFRHNGGPG